MLAGSSPGRRQQPYDIRPEKRLSLSFLDLEAASVKSIPRGAQEKLPRLSRTIELDGGDLWQQPPTAHASLPSGEFHQSWRWAQTRLFLNLSASANRVRDIVRFVRFTPRTCPPQQERSGTIPCRGMHPVSMYCTYTCTYRQGWQTGLTSAPDARGSMG